MSPLTHFSSPAFLTDFTPKNAKRWSTEYVSAQITAQVERPEISQFYNELTSSWTETPTQASITWVAFPNNVAISEGSDRARWRRADLRGVQDEYCEWTVQRNEKNEIVRVVFTAEGPEYWDRLAEMQPEAVLDLYRKHNPGFDIKKKDLFPNGKYTRYNKWNDSSVPGCIMHLAHRNNTLGAQFKLAADSTVLRIDAAGRPIRDADRLIRCSRLGGPDRNSDPHIGIKINDLAHLGALITVADPVGLYLHSFDGNTFHAPDGANVNDFWTWTRGTPACEGHEAYWLRAVFEVPDEKGYVVGDIEDQNGNRIQWGSQLADHIQVRITGQIIRPGLHTAEAQHCLTDPVAMSMPETKAMAAAVEIGDGSLEKDEEGEVCDRVHGIEDPGFCCY
ncbi:uncharacterized protein H6S33_007245 [Morchella sextelata]|uniref:uncharacterized protein n=1 Tax=Morchella sextelata TaxID=1174677 RepID=UPI001D04C7CE|nr:uncharacterized protein H6S33_007245 [Morchella sextelata]KAH0604214.1 hypothetical protein H6S33_007245 [Morchella sextelata]